MPGTDTPICIEGSLMHIRFPAHGTQRPVALQEHAQRCLRLRLHDRSDTVAHIDVTLGDPARHRGLQDMFCVMRVQLRGVPAATVVDIGGDPFDTIDRAAGRVARLAEAQWRSHAAADEKAAPALPAHV